MPREIDPLLPLLNHTSSSTWINHGQRVPYRQSPDSRRAKSVNRELLVFVNDVGRRNTDAMRLTPVLIVRVSCRLVPYPGTSKCIEESKVDCNYLETQRQRQRNQATRHVYPPTLRYTDTNRP